MFCCHIPTMYLPRCSVGTECGRRSRPRQHCRKKQETGRSMRFPLSRYRGAVEVSIYTSWWWSFMLLMKERPSLHDVGVLGDFERNARFLRKEGRHSQRREYLGWMGRHFLVLWRSDEQFRLQAKCEIQYYSAEPQKAEIYSSLQYPISYKWTNSPSPIAASFMNLEQPSRTPMPMQSSFMNSQEPNSNFRKI